MAEVTSGEVKISLGKAWWAVFVLFVAYTFSYIDRWILGLLVQPLKRDLLISDTQIGLLSGLAFALFYAIAALPIAALADRKSRRNIIAWGVTVWSLCTAISGLAQNYWHLFAARMGVGAGEAVLQPAAFSLIADLFPKEKRGLAYGVFGSGTHVGGGLALIVGGAIVQWMDHFGTISTFIGELRSWQIVFFVVGLPGLIVSLLVLTIAEPRHQFRHLAQRAAPGTYIAFLKKNRVLLSLFFSGFACMGMLTTAYGLWMPSLFIRVFQMTPGQAGFWIGIVTLVVAPIGAVGGGRVLQWLTEKGHRDAPLRLALFGMVFGGPAKLIAPLMPTFEGVLVFFAIGLFFSPWPYVAGASSLPLFTPTNMRAQISALYAFVVTIIALVGGPLLVGVFTDYVFQNEMDVGKSMALLSAIATPIMIIFTLFIFKRFRAAVEVQEKFEAAAAAA